MKLTALIISICLLAGCETAPIKTVDKIVEVPVPVPCKIKQVDKPVMPLDAISTNDDILSMVQKALAEVELRIGYEKVLEAAIKECQ